ncbi:MAG TPA: DEAD/DEAH box helicase [Polyangiaceae bacterium]
MTPPIPYERIDKSLFEKLEQRLRTIDPASVARGRHYAHDGRVERVTVEAGNEVSAVVRGSQSYLVSLVGTEKALETFCGCPAWDAGGACKHVAAVIFVLRDARRAGPAPVEDPIAGYLRDFGSVTAEGLADAIGRHAGLAVDTPPDFWRRAHEWWVHTKHRTDPPAREFRALVAEWAPKLHAEIEKVRAWTPPPREPRGKSDFDRFVASVAAEARRLHGRALATVLPGPFGEGAARFSYHYLPERRLLQMDERTRWGRGGPRFTLELPDRPEAGAKTSSPWPSLFDVFALRALLLALEERTDPAIVALAGDLERPRWERMLEATKVKKADVASAKVEDVEIAFRVGESYERGAVALTALTRRATMGRAKSRPWKRTTFEKLLDGSLTTTELDRQIARSALASVRARVEATVELATARGHELLKLLSRHPHLAAGSSKDVPDDEDPPTLAIGDLTMTMVLEKEGSLRPTFQVGERTVALGYLTEAPKTYFGSIQADGTIVSARVPPALRSWVAAALRFGDDFVFPHDAMPKVTAELEPLVTDGAAILPREALGEERPAAPEAALRVEWTGEGATVEVLVAVRPGAPLIEAGAGPKLYSFEENGRRVYVERDFLAEMAKLEDTAERIEVPLVWNGTTGVTTDLEGALALARFVEENPLGLSIEVKIGRPPKVAPFEQTTRNLDIVKEASWFSVRGNVELAGKNVSLGELLEAARLARRFVRVDAETYVELSAEVHSALLPLATAAQLAETKKGSADETVKVNAAFVEALVLGAGSFSDRSGVDPKTLMRGLEANRTRKVKATLEAGTLRPYQREGAEWMLRLAAWAPGCVLADDMGLGKTVQTASVLRARANKGPALVVAPASVCSNWIAELARFAPSLKVRWFNEDRTVLAKAVPPGTVVVVSYGMLQREADTFAQRPWSTLVLDEAQYLKNHVARRTDAVKKIPRELAIALTGTPLENHLGELWSLMDVVFPGLLGTEAAFRERFRRPIEGQKDARKLAALSRLIGPFLLRRTRSVVLEELPAREEIVEYVDLDPAETKRYAALRRACEIEFQSGQENGGGGAQRQAQMKIALLAALTRLRQLACDVSLVDPTFTGPSSKLLRATDLVSQIVEQGSKVLVFSQFTSLLERAQKSFEAAGLKVAYLAGDTPTLARKEIVDAFQAGDFDVFCISLKAGGTGLNLTRASYVLHLDPWWNPAVEEQATARAHRMGQSEPVTVYKLVARGTIEEAILEMHTVKQDLVDAVLEGRSTSKTLSPTELLELLKFGDDAAAVSA